MTASSVYSHAVVLPGADVKCVQDIASLITMTGDDLKIVVLGVLPTEYLPASSENSIVSKGSIFYLLCKKSSFLPFFFFFSDRGSVRVRLTKCTKVEWG